MILKIKDRPFQFCRKLDHMLRSSRTPLLRYTNCSSPLTVQLSFMSQDKKGRPGTTTQVAKLKDPVKLRSCGFVHFLQLWIELIVCWSFWIFSGDKRAWIRWVSRMIPKSSRTWEGPDTLSGANGIPRYRKIASTRPSLWDPCQGVP